MRTHPQSPTGDYEVIIIEEEKIGSASPKRQKKDEEIMESEEQLFNRNMLSFFNALTSKYPEETIEEKVAKKTKIYFDNDDQHINYDQRSGCQLVECCMEEKCFVVSKNPNNEIKVFTKTAQGYNDETEVSIEQKNQILTHLNSLVGIEIPKNHSAKRLLEQESKSDEEEPLTKKQKEPSKEENFDKEMLLFFLNLTSNYLDPALKGAKKAKSMIEFSNNSIAYNKTEKLELILFELTNESPPQFHSVIKYNDNRIELSDPDNKIISDQEEKDRILSHLNSLIDSEKTQFSLQQDSKEGEFEKDENQYRNIDLEKLKRAFTEIINSSEILTPIENDGLTLFAIQKKDEDGNFLKTVKIFKNNSQEVADQVFIKALFDFSGILGFELSANDPNLQFNPLNELETAFFGELPINKAIKNDNIYTFSFERYDIEYFYNENTNEKRITKIFDKKNEVPVECDLENLREIIIETLSQLGYDLATIYDDVLGLSRSASNASQISSNSVEFVGVENAGSPGPEIVLSSREPSLNLKNRRSPSQ